MPRANRKLNFWQDLELICAVDLATDVFCDVFQLSRSSLHYELEEIVRRILTKRLSPDGVRRGTPVCGAEAAELRHRKQPVPRADDEFFHDVIQSGQLPRAWDRLIDGLRDYRGDLRAKAESMLAEQPAATAPKLDAVVENTLHSLFLRILRQCKELVSETRRRGTYYSSLEVESKHLLAWHLYPSAVWQDFDLLRRVGVEWTGFRTKLGLSANPRGYDRDQIHQRRRECANKLRGANPSAEISDDEVRKLVPWPDAVREVTNILLDPEKTRDLHGVLRYYASRALQLRIRRDHEKRQSASEPNLAGSAIEGTTIRGAEAPLPELDEVVNEFLDMKVWQIVKNADKWTRDYDSRTAAGDKRPATWSPRVFNDKLLEDAHKAIDYLMNRPGNLPPSEDATSSDSNDPTPSASQTPVESLPSAVAPYAVN